LVENRRKNHERHEPHEREKLLKRSFGRKQEGKPRTGTNWYERRSCQSAVLVENRKGNHERARTGTNGRSCQSAVLVEDRRENHERHEPHEREKLLKRSFGRKQEEEPRTGTNVLFDSFDSQAGFIPRGLPLLPNNVSGVMELY
jgi:hypothetical protein